MGKRRRLGERDGAVALIGAAREGEARGDDGLGPGPQMGLRGHVSARPSWAYARTRASELHARPRLDPIFFQKYLIKYLDTCIEY